MKGASVRGNDSTIQSVELQRGSAAKREHNNGKPHLQHPTTTTAVCVYVCVCRDHLLDPAPDMSFFATLPLAALVLGHILALCATFDVGPLCRTYICCDTREPANDCNMILTRKYATVNAG